MVWLVVANTFTSFLPVDLNVWKNKVDVQQTSVDKLYYENGKYMLIYDNIIGLINDNLLLMARKKPFYLKTMENVIISVEIDIFSTLLFYSLLTYLTVRCFSCRGIENLFST